MGSRWHYTYIHTSSNVGHSRIQANKHISMHYSPLPLTSPFVVSCLLNKYTTNSTAPMISSTNRTMPTGKIAPTIAARGGAGVVAVSLGCLQFPKHNPSSAAKTDNDNYNVPVSPNK